MTDTTAIPDYLIPAMERLEVARSAHLASASRMDETTAAISQVKAQKNELEQENSNDSGAWRTAFRAGGAVITAIWRAWHAGNWCRNVTIWLKCCLLSWTTLREPATGRPERIVRHITASSASTQSMS